MNLTPTTGTTRGARTVADAMTRDPIVLRSDDPLPDAARVFDEAHISGAPVVDAQGIRWACCRARTSCTPEPPSSSGVAGQGSRSAT
ncbi:MAG: CBS domain-containing protein [Chloroflexota bacterium]